MKIISSSAPYVELSFRCVNMYPFSRPINVYATVVEMKTQVIWYDGGLTVQVIISLTKVWSLSINMIWPQIKNIALFIFCTV